MMLAYNKKNRIYGPDFDCSGPPDGRVSMQFIAEVLEKNKGTFTLQAEGQVCLATRAFSCLVEPECGDTILCFRPAGGDAVILAILSRDTNRAAELSVRDSHALKISAENLHIQANKTLDLQGQEALNLMSAGDVTMFGSNVVGNAIHSMLLFARHCITKAEHISLQAEKLLRSHAHHQLISADEDVKIDGERINMG